MLAAIPGVVTSRVGYCGGRADEPSYKRVCSDAAYNDYVEAVQVDFDPQRIAYMALLERFWSLHDATCWSPRQYCSAIFTDNGEQHAMAEAAVAARPAVKTTVEPLGAFWDAEAYHQKWLLQRKRPLFLALGITDLSELLGPAATALNAYAGGRLSATALHERLHSLVGDGQLDDEVRQQLQAVLAST